MMAWAKMKVAAGVVALTILAGGGSFVAVAQLAGPSTSPFPTSPTAHASVRPAATRGATARTMSVEDRGTPIKDLAALEQAIADSEQRLGNLRVRFSTVRQQWDGPSGTWQYNGQSEGTAWYTGMPHSKYRIQMGRDVRRWIDGTAAFLESRYTVAYDGSTYVELNLASGPRGAVVGAPRGRITAEAGPRVANLHEYDTGWGFSLYGLYEWANHQPGRPPADARVSRLARQRPGASITITQSPSVEEGHRIIHLVTTSPRRWADELVLDADRQYALVRSELRDADGIVRRRLTVSAFAEPSPGIYFPAQAEFEEHMRSGAAAGEPDWRVLYKAHEVAANDPAFTDKTLEVKWPPGTEIQNDVLGVQLRTIDRDPITGAPLEGEAAEAWQEGRPYSPTQPAEPDRP